VGQHSAEPKPYWAMQFMMVDTWNPLSCQRNSMIQSPCYELVRSAMAMPAPRPSVESRWAQLSYCWKVTFSPHLKATAQRRVSSGGRSVALTSIQPSPSLTHPFPDFLDRSSFPASMHAITWTGRFLKWWIGNGSAWNNFWATCKPHDKFWVCLAKDSNQSIMK
jgi:hypothetical protein